MEHSILIFSALLLVVPYIIYSGKGIKRVKRNKSSSYKKHLFNEDKNKSALIKSKKTNDNSKSNTNKKFLLGKINDLEKDNLKLKEYEKTYHELNKENGILKEKNKKNKSLDIIHKFCLSIGFAMMGLSAKFIDEKYGWIFLGFGVLIILSVLISKHKQ